MRKIMLKIEVLVICFILFSIQIQATEENIVSNEISEPNAQETIIEQETEVEESPTETKVEELPTETIKNETMYVQERCNIRASYSVDSSRVGGLDVGTEVTVIAEYSNGWYKIKYGGEEAYIKSGILRSTPPPEEEEAEETLQEEQLVQIVQENNDEVDEEYAELINEIGVLPEVGYNLADTLFYGIVFLSIAFVIYVKYKM